MYRPRLTITVIIFNLVATSIAFAQDGIIGPHQLVDESAELILSTIQEQRNIYGNVTNAEMVQALVEVLEPVIDFSSIASAVIGNHSSGVSTDQAELFRQIFKTTMVRLYLESFMAFEVAKIEVQEPDNDFTANSGRATVRMIASATNNTTYKINYSMRTNSADAWKVRNIVADGVNLGLTYRNQFDGAMSRYHMSIDQVIANWDEDAIVE